MAKLNKQEIDAIASKLHRELSRVAEERQKKVIEEYVPSETYSKVKELLDKRDALSDEYYRMSLELTKVRDEANKACPFYIHYFDSKKDVLNKILSNECKLSDIPSIDEIKDEVTIAAIDDSFNTSNFIQEQLEKFK